MWCEDGSGEEAVGGGSGREEGDEGGDGESGERGRSESHLDDLCGRDTLKLGLFEKHGSKVVTPPVPRPAPQQRAGPYDLCLLDQFVLRDVTARHGTARHVNHTR